MTLPQTRWYEVGEPAHEQEHQALQKIRELLPDDPLCFAWANISIPDRRVLPTEIDLLLLNAAGLFVVELKGWNGAITGSMYDWTCASGKGPASRRTSPVVATQNKARRLKSLLQELQEEGRHDRFRLPYVAPVVVLHGRRSTTKLDSSARANIYGLDTYDVKGVPTFSAFLREPTVDGLNRLDKHTVQSLVRLIEKSGMAPRRPAQDVDNGLAQQTSATPVTMNASQQPQQQPPGRAEAIEYAEPQAPRPLLESFHDDELRTLGVDAELLPTLRMITDQTELIGAIPDDVFDDLDALLWGESLETVVARRKAALILLADVDAQARAAGAVPAPRPPAGDNTVTPACILTEAAAAPEPGTAAREPDDVAERLRSVFGDQAVKQSRPRRPKAKPASAPPAPRTPALAVPNTGEPHGHPRPVTVPSERLLDLARVEALHGRASAARSLLAEVDAHVSRVGIVDWSEPEVSALASQLADHPLLSLRVRSLIIAISEQAPSAPILEVGETAPVGKLWGDGPLSPTYTLLLRIPDVFDRANGTYLSQVVGADRAALVNARLRNGRPDGGRIRVAADGTVVSRRDAVSSWFTVGTVTADEWFPAESPRRAVPAGV